MSIRAKNTLAEPTVPGRRNREVTHLPRVAVVCVLALGAIACEMSPPKPVLEGESQVALRSIQTRTFETSDREMTLRTVIATLQDLGFVIDKADASLGAVSATKLDGYELRMTVTVRRKTEDAMLVRASAQYQMEPIDDPATYQDFFTALEKSMFLAQQEVD
jgi:hypothetical protein